MSCLDKGKQLVGESCTESANNEEIGLTLDQLCEAVMALRPVVYYVVTEDVPERSPDKPGSPPTEAFFLVRLGSKQVLLCHPEHWPKLEPRLANRIRLKPLKGAPKHVGSSEPFVIQGLSKEGKSYG